MIRQMKPVTLYKYTGQEQDEYGALTSTYNTSTIDMAISVLQGNEQAINNILYEESTHIGITEATVTTNDYIKVDTANYTVTFVIPNGRYTYVYLKCVDGISGASIPLGNAPIDLGNLPIASDTQLGLVIVGDNLKIANGVLSVDTATVVEADNTRPVTSAAVNTQVGNIEVLLAAL